MNKSPQAAPLSQVLRSRRWLLWGALLALVLALLGVLVFLAAEYEEGRDQTVLERDAAQVASDIRSELFRNVQTLQSLHSVAPTADSWAAPAAELLSAHREMVRLEWRSSTHTLLAYRDTPYLTSLSGYLNREQA
ncbi:MAG: PAS domain-containing sensor histidine kinase, partial [Hydrogenophaga sp.]|nr:PAS domain-containing sensor histidine kinase [Hydrogenophaga sp.]